MLLDKSDILRGLELLSAKARDAYLTVDLAIYGGAALALAFDMRAATRDVDAVIQSHPYFVRNAVREIAVEYDWPENWFNEGVKGFISAAEQLRLMQDFQGSQQGGLRVHVPTPEYLLAMKCMAMRIDDPDAAHDVADIKNLARLLHIETPEAFFDIIAQFYPSAKITPKTAFGVEEIAEQLKINN
jgi:predicted nucleotidyltransferase